MVDALRAAREWIVPSGRVIDLHPTAAPATIHVGARLAGPIDPGGAAARHQRATAAIAAAVRDGMFTIDDSFEFAFWTHAGTFEELDGHIAANWRESRIGPVTSARARALLQERGTDTVSARETVSATCLRDGSPVA